jgi:hypothetical protein
MVIPFRVTFAPLLMVTCAASCVPPQSKDIGTNKLDWLPVSPPGGGTIATREVFPLATAFMVRSVDYDLFLVDPGTYQNGAPIRYAVDRVIMGIEAYLARLASPDCYCRCKR